MTGYTAERAQPHDIAFTRVVIEFGLRGYQVVEDSVNGHRPDGRVLRAGRWRRFDVKTGKPNLCIEVDSMLEYQRWQAREGKPVYIIHALEHNDVATWTVDTPDTACRRFKTKLPDGTPVSSGPRRRSGDGSNDDWYLVERGGTPFDDFFPDLTEPA